MSGLNFHHLRYFHAIVSAGGLTKAAERLRVSPSALSVQLRQLEDQLGHPLFERRGRQLALTEAGRIALARAETIFAEGEELVDALRGQGGRARDVIRVGALATLSRNFQTEFLRPLFAKDDVKLVLRSGSMRELLLMLDTHHIDILLSNTVPPRDASTPWVPHAISHQPVSLVGLPAKGANGSSLKQVLDGAPLILPTMESSLRAEFDSLVARTGAKPRIVAEVDDMAMLRLLTREGVGLAVVPPIVVQDELRAGTLVELKKLPKLKEHFYAITPTRRFPNPLVERLISATGRRFR